MEPIASPARNSIAVTLSAWISVLVLHLTVVVTQGWFLNEERRENEEKSAASRNLALADLKAEQMSHISGYHWVSGGHKRVSVPVAEAARLLAQNGGKLPPTPAELIDRGRLDAGRNVYTTLCKSCHTTDGTKLVGPSFLNMYGSQIQVQVPTGKDLKELGPVMTVTADDAYVRESILEPDAKIHVGFRAPDLNAKPSPMVVYPREQLPLDAVEIVANGAALLRVDMLTSIIS